MQRCQKLPDKQFELCEAVTHSERVKLSYHEQNKQAGSEARRQLCKDVLDTGDLRDDIGKQ